MEAVHTPGDSADVSDLVRETNRPLWLRAGGSKDRLGRRRQIEDLAGDRAGDLVDLTKLQGVVSYEPQELILVARPATPLTQIETLLAEQGQHLAFEPIHWGPSATLGGTLGIGASGPRRFVAGAARDFVLGLEFVDGRGRIIRAGGRVVKNVTGYDLWRAMVGAYGTLGVITEVCVKLWPRPETQNTLMVQVDRAGALALMLSLPRRPEQITGLAYSDGTLWIRVEGTEAAVGPQIASLRREVSAGEIVPADASQQRWGQIREGGGLAANGDEVLYRIVLPPTASGDATAELATLGLGRDCVDWGGGLLWAVLPASCDAAAVHDVTRRHGGTAQRVAAGPDDDNGQAFTPLAEGLSRLNETLRMSLDPKGLFSPGRMAPADS